MHVCAACALRVHCGSTAFALAEVRHCLGAALRGRDALGAARLRVGDRLGLDGGLEQCRLRRKVGWA